MRKTTNGFARLGLAEFQQQLTLIVNNMTGSADFPNLQTEVLALAAKASALDDLVQKAAGGEKKFAIARDTARKEITNMLHALGADVDAVAKGDEEILIASGFPYMQDRKSSPDMVQPDPPKVSQGVNIGEIDCRTVGQLGMKSVNFYITTDATALTAGDSIKWDVASSNKIKYTFSGLTSGQRYYIKVGLVGVREQEVISTPVSYIPQ